MRASLLALLLVAAPAAAQSHHPGPVVLLGERADPAEVPDLAGPPGSTLLLVAGAATSPQPLDARAWGGDERTRIVHLPPAQEAPVDRALLEQVRGADRVALGPGRPQEWLDALLDRERPTAVLAALQEAWSAGATLVARGDTAALVSAVFAVESPAELDWDVRNPRSDGGSRAAQGLGYQPWAMLDTETRSGGSLRRLVRSVCRERIELALWLPAESALVVELTSSRLRLHGRGDALLIDARRARRSRDVVHGARLTLLPPGSVWDAGDRRIPLESDPPQTSAPGDVQVRRVEDALAARRWTETLTAVARSGASRLRLEDGRWRLDLRVDEDTRRGRSSPGAVDLVPGASWIEGVACDLSVDGP